jgi:HEAT repeat protein
MMMYNDDAFDDEVDNPDYSLEDALQALPIESAKLVPPQVVFGFSDLDPQDLAQVQKVWQQQPEAHRIAIMERLAESSEADYMLDYSVFAQVGYADPLEAVRAAAIEAAWMDDSPEALQRLSESAQQDPAVKVRAAAIAQLGQFIHLAELEQLDKDEVQPIADYIYGLAQDPRQPLDIRRRALEASANSQRPGLNDLIERAYDDDEFQMRLSAVAAMGNTADERWEAHILRELNGNEAEMVFQAANSAGDIGLEAAVERLTELAYVDDPQIQAVSVWALGEIASDEAIDALNGLAEYAESEEDDDLLEMVEDALGNAEMMLDMNDFIEQMGYLTDMLDDLDEDNPRSNRLN